MIQANQPSYQSLLEENRRLKAELAARHTVSLDLDKGEVHVRNLKSEGIEVEQLDLVAEQVPHLVESMVNVRSTLERGKLSLPDLKALGNSPIQVQTARLRLSEGALNEAISAVAGGNLAEQGITDLHLRVKEGNQIALSGRLDKLIPVPFQVEGTLNESGPHEVTFNLQRTRVMGFLPVPRLLTNIFTSLAAHNLERAHVQQVGDAFRIDTGAFIPKNIQVDLRELNTHDGYLLVEAGSPANPPA